jgi:DNA polymerase III alpha subunit
VVEARDLERHVGESVTCFGWLSASRRTRTAQGRYMRFLTLEDPTGTVESILFPDDYLRLGHLLDGEGPYFFSGPVQQELGALCLKVTGITTAEGSPVPASELQRRRRT